MNIPPLGTRSLAYAWIETLFSAGWAIIAALLIPRADTLPGFIGLVGAAFAAFVVAALSAMYAATRSPSPRMLRLCRYGCAASVLIAFLAL
ncbi:hypothetical protein AB0J28_00775 [Streptosporangium canum]|uniref:hypothetical protein n=1 Tax=Streptosporangium canum TaxID=324952 RepID=UPI003414B768